MSKYNYEVEVTRFRTITETTSVTVSSPKKLSEEEGRELAKYTQSNYKFGKRKY